MPPQAPQHPLLEGPQGIPVERIWGVAFYDGAPGPAAIQALEGRLVVVPSGPGLGHDFFADPDYARALRAADLALVDSGFFTLLWWLRSGKWLRRLSGLRFLEDLLADQTSGLVRDAFWVFPSQADAAAAADYLQGRGLDLDLERQTYVAPMYGAGPINDPTLTEHLARCRPRLVILCLGGGVQERLGHGLRRTLAPQAPAILCTGAAIAFLSGRQTAIPSWADRLFLGWLLRLLDRPALYARRYLRALKLVVRIWTSGPPEKCE